MADKTHSDIDLDMLTEEEREGLLDDTVIDEGLEGSEGDEGDEGDGDTGADTGADTGDAGADDGADAGDDGQAAGDDAAAAAAAAQAAAAADTGAADTGDAGGDGGQGGAAEVEERPASWILPADINDKIKNLGEELDRIAASFDDGDLTAQEMRAKMKPIEQELDALKDRRTTANVSRDLAIDTYKTQTVPAFFSDHPQYKQGTVLYTMLDTELRKLQSASLDPLNPKHLQKAHEIIDGQLRAALGEGAGTKKDPAGKTPAGKTPPAKREIPPTLANVPSADITDAEDGGEFAYLDRLANKDVEAYERELGKLSDDKRDRYLAQ